MTFEPAAPPRRRLRSSGFAVLATQSWLAGVAAYVAALMVVYGERISAGDLTAVMVWSAVAALVVFPVVYAPSMSALRRLLGGCRPAWAFPLVAALLGVLPTALIVRARSGGFRELLSHEAVLFYCLFTAAGVVFGLGFVRLHGGADPT